MVDEPDLLDQRLDRMFRAVELSAGFEARLMARVQVESDAIARIDREYQWALAGAQRRRRRLLGFVTLDAAAVGALLIFGEFALSRQLQAVPSAVTGSAVWQTLSSYGVLNALVLIPIAAAAFIFAALDYGRSPE
jgi:hypothetical protein